MFNILAERLRQGRRTISFPKGEPVLPERFRGRPAIDQSGCPAGCRACADACPAGAVSFADGELRLDMGRCLFCGECEKACASGALRFTKEHALAANTPGDLVLSGNAPGGGYADARPLGRELVKLFGRSFKLRQVSAGGCNACEADVNVLTTVVFDLGRFGMDFVASPRHADGLLVTGPVTANMRVALMKTYDAVPSPKVVIASGACAVSGGPYRGRPEVNDGIGSILPVDLYVPGCPPHPLTLLDGLLRLIGRMG